MAVDVQSEPDPSSGGTALRASPPQTADGDADIVRTARSALRTRHPWLVLAIALGGFGFAVRLLAVHLGGGLFGIGNYDDAVYFSAADALVHGRLPYRDFLFLQPPGILVVLAPFAALGRVIGDPAAWAVARVAFLLIGGLNTALIAVTLRRFGRYAQLIGGLGYAVFMPAIYSERTTILEPIGTLAILLTLAAIANAPERSRRQWEPMMLVCGAVFGLAIATKFWYLLPAVLMLPLLRRGALAFAVAAGAVFVAIIAPLLAVAPAAMWHQTVADQLGRPRIVPSVLSRLSAVVSTPHIPGLRDDTTTLIVLAIVVVLAITAWTVHAARWYVVLLLAAVAFLLITPSYYRHYAALAVPFLVLAAAVAAVRLSAMARAGRPRRIVQATALALVFCYAFSGWGVRGLIGRPPQPDFVSAVQRQPGCITSNDPALLILTNRLTSDLAAGCTFWADPTGWRYDRDAEFTATGSMRLTKNTAWQRHLLSYLATGNAALVRNVTMTVSASSQADMLVRGSYEHGAFLIVTIRGPAASADPTAH